MDATITYDEVATLVGVNIPSLNPCPNFERIQVLCCHFEPALQHLPCPQSTLHGWKGMVMARELYAFLTFNLFSLPNNHGNAAVYVRPTVAGQPINNTPLTWMEQATKDTRFAHEKHYFLLMRNIERACFTALDASINNAFKVSNDLVIQRWHAGMQVINILDQLSAIYGQPTPTILKTNDTVFHTPYPATGAPEVLFCRIKEYAETALLDRNPYMDLQLVTNAICLLLMTGLYT
jgi:hypothetical protein